MKFNILAITVSSMLMTSSAFAVVGESSTVNFTGSITEASCALSAGAKGQTVELGDVASNVFTGQGTFSTSKGFTIDMTGCADSVNTAKVTFSGETATDTALKTSAGNTTNVGIQILQNGTPLKVDGSTPSTAQNLVEGNNVLEFSARYVALSNNVAAGEANGSANFTLSYE